MMLSKIKGEVYKQIGRKKKFQYNGSRNLVEEFLGVITETYDNVFLIKMETGSVRCYSYNDLLIGTVVILD